MDRATADQVENAMDLALQEAERAWQRGDWPVGAALLDAQGALLALGSNRVNSGRDLTLHAEIDVIRRATEAGAGAQIAGGTLISTMEPCPMCAWALRLAGIGTLVLGARHADLQRTDLGRYTVETFGDLTGYAPALVTGVRRDECAAMRARPLRPAG